MRRTLPPSAEIENQIDRLLAVGVGENPRESLSELARGRADWLVSEGRLMVAYNHPHGGYALSALVVTLWRRA